MARALREVLLVGEIRAVAADSMWLSLTGGQDCVAFHFTWRPDPGRVLPVVAEVERRLAGFDTRPHWGKVFTTSPAELAARYPRLADFRELVTHYDPDGKLGNDLVDGWLGLASAELASSGLEPKAVARTRFPAPDSPWLFRARKASTYSSMSAADSVTPRGRTSATAARTAATSATVAARSPLSAGVESGAVRRPAAERLADLPVVAEGVLDPAQAPAVLVGDGGDLAGAGLDRPAHRGLRVVDDQQHPDAAAAERLGAEVAVRWRLVGHPERRRTDRELGHDRLVLVGATEPEDLDGAERAA